MYFGSLQELADNPYALSRPEGRSFATIVLKRLQQVHVESSDGLSAQPLLTAIDRPFLADPGWIDETFRLPLSKQLNTKWPPRQRFAFLIGSLVAQVAYNAAILKDPAADAQFRKVISSIAPWPGASSNLRTDVAALVKLHDSAHGGTWAAINAAASTATLDIVGGT